MNALDDHQTMEREIAQLSALQRMRKCAADDDSTSLRNLYLKEMRQSTATTSVGHATVESSLCKRRRLHANQLYCRQPMRLLTQYLQGKFYPSYCYCQYPLLNNFHTLLEKNYTLPSNSNTCKFLDDWFTAKFRYLHIPLLANAYNPFFFLLLLYFFLLYPSGE